MNRYDYKVVNTDAKFSALKHAITYIVLLVAVLTTALVVVFILFELYLRLIACGVSYIVCFAVSFATGKKPFEITYVFTDMSLKIYVKNGKEYAFILKNLVLIKNAEKSDFFKKDIINLSFIENKIILKNALNNDNFNANNVVAEYEGSRYLMIFDDYAKTFLKGVIE